MRHRSLEKLGLAVLAGPFFAGQPLAAETDITAMTPAERAAFHRELRAALAEIPELPALLDGRAPVIATPYAEEIDEDLTRLAAHADQLFAKDLPGFGPQDARQTLALFTRPGCAACQQAETDLRALAERFDLRVTLIDIDTHDALARALGLDMAPSYVFPDMMLRGQMPAIVLERYLAD